MRLRFVLAGLIGALAVCGTASQAYAFEVPPNDGYVTDTASVLSSEERAQISEMLDAYRKQTSNQIAILIVNTLNGEPIADVAVQVGRKWGVGTKENSNGILILVSYSDRELFLATGYGLEGAVPDIVAKGIIEQEITPKFRDGDYAGGLKAGITALEKHIGGEYTPDRYARSSADASFGFTPFLFFFVVILLQWGVVFLGRTKSWWLGGVLGAGSGLGLAIAFGWWLSIPLLFVVGLLIDFLASKTYRPVRPGRRGGRGGWGMGGGFGSGGGGGGGGFGGFGGGSFGGGGAGGKW
ncbi:MAG: TPM domain-containing protein [Candidatus Peribacteraceae bacterium]|nr:TPM domain-containing protein [Candidatus Peribacteraceae bacterium]MDD5742715.1 TPM domain-containing protein [Candidatus Peribacteraceae bacterium]